MAQSFNEGGYAPSATNSSIGRQINDKYWSRRAVIEAARTKVFSQLGSPLMQKKNYGDKMVKYHDLPILDDRNINSEGIDANGVKVLAGVWYAYDADGVRIVEDADADNNTGYSTEDKAKDKAGDDGTVRTGNGNMYGTSKDLAIQNGAFPVLSEEGGWANRVGMKRLVIEAQIEEYGFFQEFTKKALEMDTEKTLKARMSREMGAAQGTIREAQIRNALIGQAEQNRVFAGDATAIDEVGAGDILTYESLRKMERSLTLARAPKDTKIITGQSKFDTRVVGKARYVYVPTEALPTLEDMEHNGVKVWKPVETYAGATTVADGEIGSIGQFRFIEVEDMASYAGQGAKTGDDDDDEDGANRYSSIGSDGEERYDVFPILFVGNESFATIGFEGDVAKVKTKMPGDITQGYDAFGNTGVMSISWYFGIMFLHPEWIRMINCSLKES
jgi:N4-gp56 family major capsid protein